MPLDSPTLLMARTTIIVLLLAALSVTSANGLPVIRRRPTRRPDASHRVAAHTKAPRRRLKRLGARPASRSGGILPASNTAALNIGGASARYPAYRAHGQASCRECSERPRGAGKLIEASVSRLDWRRLPNMERTLRGGRSVQPKAPIPHLNRPRLLAKAANALPATAQAGLSNIKVHSRGPNRPQPTRSG